MNSQSRYDLIITIVNRGCSELVIKAAKAACAEGGATIMGRGAGIHETKTILGIPMEPEGEIVFTAILKRKRKKSWLPS